MSPSKFKPLRWPLTGAFFCLLLSGCTVVTVTGAAISVTAGAIGLAADAAIGTAKIVGKGVGKAADALMEDEPASPTPQSVPNPPSEGLVPHHTEAQTSPPATAAPPSAPMDGVPSITEPTSVSAHGAGA